MGRERVFDVVAPYQLPCAGVCTPDLTQVAADFVFFGRIAAAWQQACRGDEVASGRRVRGHCVRHHDGVDDGAAVSASIDGEQCGPGRWFGGGEPPCLQAVRDGSEKSGETGDVVGTDRDDHPSGPDGVAVGQCDPDAIAARRYPLRTGIQTDVGARRACAGGELLRDRSYPCLLYTSPSPRDS